MFRDVPDGRFFMPRSGAILGQIGCGDGALDLSAAANNLTALEVSKSNAAGGPIENDNHHRGGVLRRFDASERAGAGAGRRREGGREVSPDAQGRPLSNPGLLDSDRGEALWTTAAGPSKATLEKCDLGKGPGVVDGRLRGAAALLRRRRPGDGPRDAADVVHGEAAGLQPCGPGEAAVSRGRPAGEGPRRDRDLRCGRKSNGRKFAAKLDKPQEQAAVALGEAIFYRRQGPHDFGCTTCHNDTRPPHPACRACRICRSPRRRRR